MRTSTEYLADLFEAERNHRAAFATQVRSLAATMGTKDGLAEFGIETLAEELFPLDEYDERQAQLFALVYEVSRVYLDHTNTDAGGLLQGLAENFEEA